MNLHIPSVVLALFFLIPSLKAASLVVPQPGESRLGGRAGEAVARCLESRTYSPWVRGPLYQECEDAFKSGLDDRWHGWQNEYWGKTMLCFAGAAGYTQDPELKAWIVEKARTFVRTYQKPNGYLSTYSDFASASNLDDPDSWFSIWF